ncbi:MAG: TlpA family protein disulfide reductase [Pseudomonadota bacterium]|nr:TlpA family protein disulfide reductase [Pseudomonadota bacterium]
MSATPASSAIAGLTRRQCVVAGLGALVAAPAVAQQAAALGAVVEWPALQLIDGSMLEPAAWRDRAAVVVFWATWCPFCKRHNAHLDKLYRSLADKPLRVLGIAIDTNVQAVRSYMASNGYRFPVALDSAGMRARLGLRSVIPMTCVFDRERRLVQALPGEMFEEDVIELGMRAAQRG